MSNLQNSEEEIWVPVVGFELKYIASNLGRVKSLDRYISLANFAREIFSSRVGF